MANYTFDKDIKIIEVDLPTTGIQIQELIDEIRNYEDNLVNFDIPKIANAGGKDDLGGGAEVGITLTLLDGWTIGFADRAGPGWTTCIVQDGNLVATSGGTSYNPIEQADYVSVIQLGAVATTIATADILSALSAYDQSGGVAKESTVSGIPFAISGGTLLALSAYEVTGVASKFDVTGTSAQVDLSAISGVMNESLSAYEATGVASKIDINNIEITGVSAEIPASALDYIITGVSGAIVSGIGEWGDLRWSKIYGIPLDQWDITVK